MDFVEADMTHHHTPFYVVQSLITILLGLESCSSVSERETKIQSYIKDEDLKEELCLLNDLLGTHVSVFTWRNVVFRQVPSCPLSCRILSYPNCPAMS